MIKRLNELFPHQSGRILRLRGMGPLRQRMMDMGLVPGAEIKVVRVAPLGDPIEYEVKGYHLSLRQRESQHIFVEVNCFTLGEMKEGELVRVVDVYNGRHFHHRMDSLGLRQGQTLKVLKNSGDGPITIETNNGDFQIGLGMARKIMVEPVHTPGEHG